jgi:CubicO group peptidase (beta-lactamase class C family)
MHRVVEAAGFELARASPAEVGMDAALLQRAVAELPPDADHGLRSMLVMRQGKLVFEQYWNGRDAQVQQDLRSVTKSITSLLVGAAITRGLIQNVDEPVQRHLGALYPHSPALARGLTVEQLLTMRSGQACNDRDPSSPGQEDTMYRQRDWVAYFMALPAAAPGAVVAQYCTGGVVALGRVLTQASGQSVQVFADQALFAPLGIKGARWATFDEGRQTDTGGHLMLRPRDLLKIGQLVLQQGRWQGQQLLPQAWIAQSTAQHTQLDGGNAYGYLWWRFAVRHAGGEAMVLTASGNGGQALFVVPELDLVAVFTGGNYNVAKAQRAFQIMRQQVLPAVRITPAQPPIR